MPNEDKPCPKLLEKDKIGKIPDDAIKVIEPDTGPDEIAEVVARYKKIIALERSQHMESTHLMLGKRREKIQP